MTGKGKVNLSFNYPGKQQRRRHSFSDSREYTWDFSHGQRFRDGVGGGDATLSELQSNALALGWIGQSGPFLSYDTPGFLGKMPSLPEERRMSGSYTRRSSKKTSKGAALARKLRGLGGSPEPVSSLESCLRAQLADALVSNRVKAVSRPLNVSSSVAEEFDDEDEDDDDEATLVDNSTTLPSIVGNAVEESVFKRRLSALPKLPNISKFLKEHAAKLSITRKAENSINGDNNRMGVRPDDAASGFSNAGNCSVSLPSFETVHFSLGVGLGVLFASSQQNSEVKRLSKLLEETQSELQTLKSEPARRESPSRTNRFDSANESEQQEDQMADLEAELEAELDQLTGGDSVTMESQHSALDEESEQQEDQMADLEAELEAELDQLTGGDSVTMESQYSALDEMDMDASVVYGDLAPAGLPGEVEEDTDEDLSPSGRPSCSNNFAVSPRELTRLLRKLQTARQEVLINELEEDLEAALSKLQSKEKELEIWKDKVRRLSGGSLVPASGDESLTPRTPTEDIALVGRYSSSRDEASEVSAALRSADPRGGQELSHLPTFDNGAPACGIVLEKEPAGLGSLVTLGPAIQYDVKSSLHSDSRKQDPKEIVRKSSDGTELSGDGDASKSNSQLMIRLEEDGSSQADASARDCKPILDNSQIITQLIDSVHGLESYGDRAESMEMGSATPSLGRFSSSVSISDTWDHPIESATPEGFHGAHRGTSLPRAKFVVPHPSRRSSLNSDLGNPVPNRKLDNEKSSSLDANQCTDVVRYSEAVNFSKSVSDMSEGETADYRTDDIPYSMKYVDSTMKPASAVGVGVCRAGQTTPVEKVDQQFLMTSQTASGKWPGELSPTVLEKIARWDGLEGETPGPATGSDWECQSRASESEQQCALDAEYDNVNVFSEENLVLEAEEMLGRMLIKRIVEKSRLGSDSLVKKAQSALATLERDDGGEADVYHVEDTYMNDRMDSEADLSDDNWEKQQTGFLDAAVREEYEFSRRLEIISKERRAMKVAKEKGAKEAGNSEVAEFDTIPELNPGSKAQLSPGIRLYGATQASSKDGDMQAEKEKQAGESNMGGRDNWLSRGVGRQDISRGSGEREDEVRSRRRL